MKNTGCIFSALLLTTGLLGQMDLAGGAEIGRHDPDNFDKHRNPSALITGFQLALIHPVQLFSESCDVYGLRLDLLYGKNAALNGMDLGVVNQLRDDMCGVQIGAANFSGPMYGMQLGVLGVASGEMIGWQLSGVNISRTSAAGLQTGLVNVGGGYDGLQIGGFNYAEDYNGLQLGVINVCHSMSGVQIGALNFILNGPFLVFCPVFNFCFW
jgi:hypothetical protein